MYYEELITHVPNMMNAYGQFQYQSKPRWMWSLEDALESGQCIYEFTAHLSNTSGRMTELQIGLDKMCSDFHSHLSRLLLGNNWTISKVLHLQPMLICCFDHEGTRQRKHLSRSVYPHVHGLIIIHDTTIDEFKEITEGRKNERRYLIKNPRAFKEVSFQPVFNGVEGIKRYIDYCLKFDKTNQNTGDNLYTLDVYPKKNEAWNLFYQELSDSDLYAYH